MRASFDPVGQAKIGFSLVAVTPGVLGSGTTANAYGAWTDIMTVPFTTNSANIYFRSTNSSSRNFRMQLGYRLNGIETIVLEDIWVRTGATADFNNTRLRYPLQIPAGATLISRGLVVASAANCTVSGTLFGRAKGYGKGGRFLTLNPWINALTQTGAVTATGTTPTAFVEAVSSLPYDVKKLIIQPHNNNVNSARAGGNFMFDIAVGASGSEQVIHSEIAYSSTTLVDALPILLDIPIARGSRIALRGVASIAGTDSWGLNILGMLP